MNQQQLEGQIRTLIPLLGGIAITLGATSESVSHYTAVALMCIGPAMLVVNMIWSYAAHSREAAMAQAAKPVAAGIPAPIIVLPIQERQLADKLPANVTASLAPNATASRTTGL